MPTIDVPGKPENFAELGLSKPLLLAVAQSGYTIPTPIQRQVIPHILSGSDVVGQAQTGTGKTAAFALPLLDTIKFDAKNGPQVLVLAPTRELAIQVSESFTEYGASLRKVKVLPIYGGQEYPVQLRGLQRNPHIIVGTPGRIMDHLRKGSLDLSSITGFVLDEADEMLKMGFLEDVEWILKQTPSTRQIALFSATMPASIKKIAQSYLKNPVEITIKGKTATATDIQQRYLVTNGRRAKIDAIERILAVEEFAGVLIFVRTKAQTLELAEHLSSQNFRCGALNGDIPQDQRLRMVDQLKTGKLDIIVATDVAARGLDVDRVSHVINYDVPFDAEAYIHRIGRTGRAGRAGTAILFLHPREKKMLRTIETKTRTTLASMKLPTSAEINKRKIEIFFNDISSVLASDCSDFEKLISEYCKKNDSSPHLVAGALAKMLHDKTPLFADEEQVKSRQPGKSRPAGKRKEANLREKSANTQSSAAKVEPGMDRYRLEVGEIHGVKPGNIVGAIANEAAIDGNYIGRIDIHREYSTVDLPYGMPTHILRLLQKARVNNRQMLLRRETISLPIEEQEKLDQPRKKKRKKPSAEGAKSGSKTRRKSLRQQRMN